MGSCVLPFRAAAEWWWGKRQDLTPLLRLLRLTPLLRLLVTAGVVP